MMGPAWIHCGSCGAEYRTSPEDPDATLSDLIEHIRRQHFIAPEFIHELVREGRRPQP